MNGMPENCGQIIRRWIARSIETPSIYVKSAWAATLTIAETLFELVDSQLLPDIQRLKEANLQAVEASARKSQAEANIKEAEALHRLAEAVEAANRSAILKRRDAIAKAEKTRRTAEAAKTEAEAEAIRIDAESRRIAAIGEAKARLIEAISSLQQYGGSLSVNQENLDRILKIEAPKTEADSI